MALETSTDANKTETEQSAHEEQQHTVKISLNALQLESIKGVLVSESDQTDIYSDEDLQVVVVGQPRSYATDTFLSSADIANLFDASVDSLYSKISGRFLLLVVDKKTDTCWLVNDHMASIPCYWYSDDEQLIIATELNGIIEQVPGSLTLSPQALFNYCYFHCIPAPDTIYQEVRKLQPAELYKFGDAPAQSQGTLYRPAFTDEATVSDAQYKQCMDEIEFAVKHSLDDACGAFLSGGLDSSTVSGMLAKLRTPARTFSVGFNEKGYDETEFAEITANHFGTEHEAAYLEPEYITDNFRKVAAAFDEPFGNSSALAAYFCASYAKQQGINTMLAGDGGDELFAGNSRYAKQKLFFPFERLPAALKVLMRAIFVKTPLSILPGFKKVASYINQADNPLPDRLQAYNFLHRFSPADMFTEDFLKQVDIEQPLQQLRDRYQESNANSPIDKMLYMDWKFTLADNDLIKVTKMCQLAGVDVKFPLLEKELTDFSCTLSPDVKLPGQKLRHFFKTATKDFLAPETLNKSKHGFGLPFGRWMRSTEGLINITQESLESLKTRNIIRPEFIDKAMKMQSEEHSAYYGELIWILTVLELWLQSRKVAA